MGKNYFGYIYKTTNLINNKIYVGLKRNSKFIPSYLGSGGCKKKGKESGLLGAIKKYGKENFKVEILEWCYDNKTLCEKEWYWKSKLNVFDPKIGYNIYKGVEGYGLTKQQLLHWENPDRYKEIYKKRTERLKQKYGGSCISEETRAKIRENSRKIKHPCSETTKQKISQANKGKVAWNKGKSMSKEQREYLSKYFTGRPNYKKRGKKYTEEQRKHVSLGRKGQRNWTNGIICKISRVCPGPDWYIGKPKLIKQ